MKKIVDIKKILNRNFEEFLLSEFPTTAPCIEAAIREACKQILELASENAKLKRKLYVDLSDEERSISEEILNDNGSSCPFEGIFIDRQSIFRYNQSNRISNQDYIYF